MAVNYPRTDFSLGSTSSYQVNSITTEFGDGYQTQTPNGINHIRQTGQIVHQLMPQAEVPDFRAFLKANVGTNTVVTIANKMEDPTGQTETNVYLTGWSESYTGLQTTFTVNYREAFNE